MMMITCWILWMPASAGAGAVTPCDLAAGWAAVTATMAHSARAGYIAKRRRNRTCKPFHSSGRDSTLPLDRLPDPCFYLQRKGKPVRQRCSVAGARGLLTLASGPHYVPRV